MAKNYLETPKFVHNLWTENEGDYYLRFISGLYEVEGKDAKDFMKMRTYCTGNNTVTEISEKSKLSKNRVQEIVSTLYEIGMLRTENKVEPRTYIDKVNLACEMWAEQIEETHLFNKIVYGDVGYNVLIGFLLETYHYIKQFPETISGAIQASKDLRVKSALQLYQQQETGHEEFILSSLIAMGMKKDEVESSIPLVSTSNIINMMSALFTLIPTSVFLVAKVIESHDYDENEVKTVIRQITEHYQISEGVMEPFFEHSRIDYELGHSRLFDEHRELIEFDDLQQVSFILNSIHDIKHSIDLQCLEIEEYYSKDGNYIPRQRVDYFGI